MYSIHRNQVNNVNAKIKLKLESKHIKLQIDSGASANIISEKVFNSLHTNAKLTKSEVKLFAYGATKPLPVIGWFQGLIETRKKLEAAKFYVVKGSSMDSLLGLETALSLGVIKIIKNVDAIVSKLPPDLRKIIEKYESRFDGIGKLKDTKIKIDDRSGR